MKRLIGRTSALRRAAEAAERQAADLVDAVEREWAVEVRSQLHAELEHLDSLVEDDVVEVKPVGPQPGRRGWKRRGGGRAGYVQPPVRWRGTSNHVCGLNPWTVGASAPLVGVPLGRILASRAGAGAGLCCDPLSWFGIGLISRPSLYIEGEPGLGKSTVVRRIVIGVSAFGVKPIIMGDLKREYVGVIAELGGQVIPLGPGRGYLNVLDASEAHAAGAAILAVIQRHSYLAGLYACDGDSEAAELARIEHQVRADELTEIRSALLADAHSRRLNMVLALLTIQRHSRPEDWEESILDRAIRHLDATFDGVPTLHNLRAVIEEAPPAVREAANDRGDLDRYQDKTDRLLTSLIALLGSGRLGETFAQQTSQRPDRRRALCFDISGIDAAATDLKAAGLMACWSVGFGMVRVAQALADAGIEPEQHYMVVLDELWQALRAAPGIVDLVDNLTRLDRNEGVGQIQITHSLADLNALAEIDRQKARGFAERAGMVMLFGLPLAEMPLIGDIVGMSDAEKDLVTSWSSPPAWDTQGRQVPPPGRGKVLVKVGGRPGIPFQVELTEEEIALNDTNRRWKDWMARSRRGGRVAA